MTLTVELPEETEKRLRERAAERGLELAEYVREVLEELAGASGEGQVTPLFARPGVPAEEIFRRLEELSAGLPPLPPLPRDFSRADIYGEHD